MAIPRQSWYITPALHLASSIGKANWDQHKAAVTFEGTVLNEKGIIPFDWLGKC